MTISFDAIWIPTSISVLALGWASFVFADARRVVDDLFFSISLGLVWPALPVLSAWLIWALMT